jgi:hypothetical protein
MALTPLVYAIKYPAGFAVLLILPGAWLLGRYRRRLATL